MNTMSVVTVTVTVTSNGPGKDPTIVCSPDPVVAPGPNTLLVWDLSASSAGYHFPSDAIAIAPPTSTQFPYFYYLSTTQVAVLDLNTNTKTKNYSYTVSVKENGGEGRRFSIDPTITNGDE
jgi:hypothetical protein